ncbi:hypothetical protein B484DRAFT_450817, partial [Ochromonadaceae sp. CCMP2298]
MQTIVCNTVTCMYTIPSCMLYAHYYIYHTTLDVSPLISPLSQHRSRLQRLLGVSTECPADPSARLCQYCTAPLLPRHWPLLWQQDALRSQEHPGAAPCNLLASASVIRLLRRGLSWLSAGRPPASRGAAIRMARVIVHLLGRALPRCDCVSSPHARGAHRAPTVSLALQVPLHGGLLLQALQALARAQLHRRLGQARQQVD